MGLGFPLLADPDYRIIDAFGLVNTNTPKDAPFYGFAFAGYYLVNPEGIVTAKFFNEANNDRTTAANILIREFDDEGQRQGSAETKHLTLNWSASNHTLRPGQRAALVLDVDLEPRMQLYAPGKHRYITVDWELDDLEGLAFLDPKYPESETKYLEAIEETVPVYHDSLTIVRDIHLLGGREMPDALAGKKEIEVSGPVERLRSSLVGGVKHLPIRYKLRPA